MKLFLGKSPDDASHLWSEDHIQMYVVQMARKAGYYVAADFNAGKRNPSKAKAMGMLAGVPDLRFYFPHGKIVWIELKTNRGALSESQKNHQAILQRNGHTVATVFAATPVSGWEQVAALLKNYEAIR